MVRIRLKNISFIFLTGISFCWTACNQVTSNAKNGQLNAPLVLQADENQGNNGGMFDIPEIEIVPSPDAASTFSFPKQQTITDYSVSPRGAHVAVLTEQQGQHDITFWSIGASKISDVCALPKNFKAETVVWHPRANALFVLGTEEATSCIYRIEKTDGTWTSHSIFSSKQRLKNMVACPQPFVIGYDYEHYAYRLFLGMDNGDNTYRIVSITEQGKQLYQVVGPAKTQTTAKEYRTDMAPSTMYAAFALPVAFHPAGHQLIWHDKQHNYFVATYDRTEWGDSKPAKLPFKNKEAVIPTPNGLGLISWQKNTPGIETYLLHNKSTSRQLDDYQFESAPVSVPDGKGIVGTTVQEGIHTLHYVPVQIPLHNVLNAWLFIHSAEELDLFQKQYGLFRPSIYDQLYTLYETESYYGNSSEPARPYLVTTDIFWEIFAAAYQGIFMIKEREQAIPNFWKFVNEADHYFKTNHNTSKWNGVFTALTDLKANRTSNEETLRIINEADDLSAITREEYAYSDLKPRGHYTSSEVMALYFKAFRYFTTILSDERELENLPANISQYAINWINSYSEFIAPSRSSLVWKDLKTTIPDYCQYPMDGKAIFPLSWGFDNEIFNNTVYHRDFPEEVRMEGPNGARLLPSGLDIAAVMGNGLSEKLMADEYAKYPPLRKMIANLRSNYKTHAHSADFKNNLYNQWMNAMAVQWVDSVHTVSGVNGAAIWQTKRLQTGLATWATLRHATVLVNERVAAECGEGGFEELLLKSPRGAVEADPYTFRAIADLFRELLQTAAKLKTKETNNQALYNGLSKRLEEAIEESLLFASMAEKERKGEKLTRDEYEKIVHVARVAEHLFLIFRSLEDNDYGLSIPDPIGKIADVAQGDGYLMAAVGNPLEWDYMVPYYGRYQIVKGAIYSYYEFASATLLNDEEWREKATKQAVLPWIKPYVTSYPVSGNTGY